MMIGSKNPCKMRFNAPARSSRLWHLLSDTPASRGPSRRWHWSNRRRSYIHDASPHLHPRLVICIRDFGRIDLIPLLVMRHMDLTMLLVMGRIQDVAWTKLPQQPTYVSMTPPTIIASVGPWRWGGGESGPCSPTCGA
jgi:hypothetical protein